MSDFYRDSAERRLQQLSASRAASVADLESHKLNGDYDAAGECIQQLANIDAERANLTQLYQNYEQSQRPPAPREISPEERLARPISHMDWSDVVELTRGSKYARNIKPDDPALLAGWNEVRARRSRGE